VLPDRDRFQSTLAQFHHRFRLTSAIWALVIGAIAAAGTGVALSVSTLESSVIRGAAAAIGAVVSGTMAALWWRRWTPGRVAIAMEARDRGLDNLVVTAEELIRTAALPRTSSLRQSLLEQASNRLGRKSPATVQPLNRPALSAMGSVLMATVIVTGVPNRPERFAAGGLPGEASTTAALAVGDLRVVVTPPAYTGHKARMLLNPSELMILEGTTVRLETPRAGGEVQVVSNGRSPTSFVTVGEEWVHEFVAVDAAVLLIRASSADSPATSPDRLLHVRVEPDRRPLVRILAPAKDLVFGEPQGTVAIAIEARDDLALQALTLRYTKVSGSGETFTFEEGQVPVKVRTSEPGEWRGEAEISLAAMKLADGDTLVYRAVATDRKPGADPSTSDTFLIEIGRLAGVASTGFAVDEVRDRQGLSQQMLIIKTERLHAARNSMTTEALQEQSRLLAVEQRMVKAEFVFMTGGEVADEVQEAEHAHELAEGRFENAAQVELLAAIREMSRAEARLNAADTGQALRFERAALQALQRAFDRRRYLLRTLPERARIDLERRLTGDLASVKSPERGEASPVPDQGLDQIRRALAALESAIGRREGLGAALAAETLTLDPPSNALQQAAIAIASGASIDDRVRGARAAHGVLVELLRRRLAPPPQLEVLDQPALGRFVDELRKGRR
jgi:hypothetical protein